MSDLPSIESTIDAVIADSTTSVGNLSSVHQKKRKSQIDEHLKKRRAFERRFNKYVQQSKKLSKVARNKRLRNGLRLQRLNNARFNKLLMSGKVDLKKKPSSGSEALSTAPKDQNSNLSVYDFESDDETDIFMSYNSRFTPNLMGKTSFKYEKKDPVKEEDIELRLEKDGSPETGENSEKKVGKFVSGEKESKSASGNGKSAEKSKSEESKKQNKSEPTGGKLSKENGEGEISDKSTSKAQKRVSNDDESKKRKSEKLRKNKKIRLSAERKVAAESAESSDRKEKENEQSRTR